MTQKIKSKGGLLALAAALVTLTSLSSNAAISLTCAQKTSGTWGFGTSPYACNVSPSMTQAVTKSQYAPVIFNHSKTVSAARADYMSNMYTLLRDVGTYYIQKRKPTVSTAEKNGFLQGLYTLAHQETYWTHYRQPTDGIIRYMRGDSDHGHGMMQIDDRSHVAALKEGKGVDLAYNIVYGLDVYYAAWVKSATASCVGSSTNYTARARASWSAYNGGSGRICRFATSPTSGDKSYATKLSQKAWLSSVRSTTATTPFNVKCLVEGTRPCALSQASAALASRQSLDMDSAE